MSAGQVHLDLPFAGGRVGGIKSQDLVIAHHRLFILAGIIKSLGVHEILFYLLDFCMKFRGDGFVVVSRLLQVSQERKSGAALRVIVGGKHCFCGGFGRTVIPLGDLLLSQFHAGDTKAIHSRTPQFMGDRAVCEDVYRGLVLLDSYFVVLGCHCLIAFGDCFLSAVNLFAATRNFTFGDALH